MKMLLRYCLIGACGILIGLSGNCFASSSEDFFDVVKYSVVTNGYISSFTAHYNGAKVVGTWRDSDQDGNLDANERILGNISIYKRNSGDTPTLISGANFNREELKDWAQENVTEILDVIIPGGIEEAQGASSESVMGPIIFTKFFKRALPASLHNQEASSNFNSSLEYQSLDINNDSGSAYLMTLEYNKILTSGFEIGFIMPYKYTAMSDEVDSTSHYIAFNFYGKKPVRQWNDMSLNLGGDLFGSLYYVSSDAIEHAGNLKYGASIFSSFDKDLKQAGIISVAGAFQITKSDIPFTSLIPDDNIFVKEAIDWVKSLDSIKTITYGINYGIPFKNDTMAINFEVIRSHYISDDISDDRDVQSTAGMSLSYSPKSTFVLDLGVRHSFEMEDMKTLGIVFGANYKF